MANFNFEKAHSRTGELRQSVENKKGIVEKLETTKKQINDARTEIEGSDISEESKEVIIEAFNEKREEISEQADQLSDELGSDLKELEDVIQEVKESQDSNQDEQKRLEQKKSLLEKLGMGAVMQESIDILKRDDSQLEDLIHAVIDARKEAEEAASRASRL